jgi:tetratricopeptide (TPR) repeat protein
MGLRVVRHCWFVAFVALLLATSFTVHPAVAEPVLDQAVAGAQLITRKSCMILKVDFNFRVRYASHFPLERGDELRIVLRPIDRAVAAALTRVRREAIRVPDGKLAFIKAITFEADQPINPVVRIQFEHPVSYQVGQSGDFESILVAIAGTKLSPTCRPELPSDLAPLPNAGAVVYPPDAPARPLTPADLRAAGAAMDEARAALKKGNFNGAAALFTKVLRLPPNKYSAEAEEFLGVTYQKMGRLADARAEYDDYLHRYPSGEGHDRVRERLAGIGGLAAPSEPPPEALRAVKAPPLETGAPTWSLSGSASQFYIRDDSFETAKDPSIAPNPNDDRDAHRVHQNQLLTSLDLFATYSDDTLKSKFRFSGTEEHSFAGDPTDVLGIAAFYSETTLTQLDLMGRVGRQTRNTGGVLGRFDGGLVSWRAVDSRFDTPFKNEKFFYGASVDFGPFLGGVETSLYAIQQQARSLIDRQAVGAEFRYFDPNKSLFGTVDYDLHFQELNAAIFSGSWTLFDKSTIYGEADYRKTPFLTAWNALQGQPFLTLFDMLKFNTEQQIDQLAIDRTATYRSAMLGYSRPITDKLQVSFDATAVDVSGTIASGGVDATPPVGTEWYYSAQLIGSNIFKDGDIFITGLRYADLSDSHLYVLDFNTRFPLFSDFRISPRLRLGYRTGKITDLTEYTVLPSVLFDYYWTKDLSFELEIGDTWTQNKQSGVQTNSNELFITVGARYDFYADGKSKCLFPWPTCRMIGEQNGKCGPGVNCR